MARLQRFPSGLFLACTLVTGISGASLPALASVTFDQDNSSQSASGPGVIQQLRQCQTITDNQARLTCFDRGMAAFDAANRTGEVAIIDRVQIEQTNRQLFGFQVPNLGHLFGNNTTVSTGETINEIETTLVKAQRRNDGRWVFELADGSVWHQTNNDRFNVRDREGDPVRIRRASLSSYLMTVGGSRGIRVQRQ